MNNFPIPTRMVRSPSLSKERSVITHQCSRLEWSSDCDDTEVKVAARRQSGEREKEVDAEKEEKKRTGQRWMGREESRHPLSLHPSKSSSLFRPLRFSIPERDV